MERLILSYCDYSLRWPSFYRSEDGYRVIGFDLKNGDDVRLVEYVDAPVYGLLFAPPCNHFSTSGAQYWNEKDADGRTLEALAIVDACLRAVAIYRKTLKFWALENPVGRLRRWLGPPAFSFNPCDFGGWGDESDAYTKKTLLWGEFNKPEKRPVTPIRTCSQGSWIQKLGGKSERTKELRSMTPLGFSRAFREANP